MLILLGTSEHSPAAVSAAVSQLSISPGLIGTFLSPIALVLSLRANQALNRLMDVRKAWGLMGRSIRSMAGLFATYGMIADPSIDKAVSIEMISISLLAARYLAIFGWCMKAMFRKDEDDAEIVRAVLPPEEAIWLLSAPSSRPIAILSRLRSLIQQLTSTGQSSVPPMIHLSLEQRLYDLEASFGTNNRILISPIPPTYTRHTSRALCLFLFLLPLTFVGVELSPIAVVLSVVAITYVIVGLDEIGLEIEHPFPLLPMQGMASTFQTNVQNQFVLSERIPYHSLPSNR